MYFKSLPKALLLYILFISVNATSQSHDKSKGKVFGSIYFDAFTEVNSGYNKSGMEIKRAYFGYKYKLDKNISAYIKLDIGSPEDLSLNSHIKRYAYFKNAGIKYTKDKLTVNIGIIDVLMFTHQEKSWGHRYIAKSFLDAYKFGPKADIGFNANYKFSKYFIMNIGFYNGEGYSKLQGDDSYRVGLGIVSHPFKNSTVKVYLDYSKKDIDRIGTFFFLGYKVSKKLSFGAEYNYQFNNGFVSEQDLSGFSVYVDYYIMPKLQLFMRYDYLDSKVLPNSQEPWHYAKDGDRLITGIQYDLRKNFKIAIDYQSWNPHDEKKDYRPLIFVNLLFKF